MAKSYGKQKITVYDVDGRVIEVIHRTVYRYNLTRRACDGQYFGLRYSGVRPRVYGDNEHPGGLYIFKGDYVSQSNMSDAVRKMIHANHVHDERDILSINNNALRA